MLSTVNSISIEKSKILTLSYSCPILLRKIYLDPDLSIEDKKNILQDKFHDLSLSSSSQNNKKNRMEYKLSHRLYHIFSSSDPEKKFDSC